MAHNLYGSDTMAYNKKNGMPWHGLGTAVDGLMTTAEAIKLGKLDFTVEKSPMFTRFQDNNKDWASPEVADIFAVRRTDTNKVLGTVGKGYEIIQNTEAFGFFDSITDKACIETVGCLGENGGTIWIMAKLPDDIIVKGNDVINCYLLLYTAHDGTCSVICKFTPVRVVCQNTANMALSGMQKEVRIKHTKTAITRLNNAHKLLGIAAEQRIKAGEIFNLMAMKFVTPVAIKSYLDSLFPIVDDGKAHTRTQNIREKVMSLFREGKGNKGETVYDLYNGTTEYVDHYRVVKGEETDNKARWEASTFGSGVAMKESAFDAACALL